MNTVADFGQWWNLIYVLPFGLGVVLVFMSVLGAGRHGLGGAHAGHGLHLGHGNLGHTAGHAGGHTAGHTGHAAAHGHAQQQGHTQQHGRGSARRAVAEGWSLARALHVQNLPPLLLAQNFFLFWGIFGWAANQFFGKAVHDPARFIVPSLLTTVAGSLIMTLALSAVMSRFTPSDETFVVTKRDLEGRVGEAIAPITDRSGSVYARDAVGTLHHLPCRIRPDGSPVKKGEPVLVIEYHPEGDFYWVKRWTPPEAEA